MIFNPHKLGVHKVLQHIPLNALFDAPYKRRLAKAVNIADLRAIAKSRAHKVRFCVLISCYYFLGVLPIVEQGYERIYWFTFLILDNLFFLPLCVRPSSLALRAGGRMAAASICPSIFCSMLCSCAIKGARSSCTDSDNKIGYWQLGWKKIRRNSLCCHLKWLQSIETEI